MMRSKIILLLSIILSTISISFGQTLTLNQFFKSALDDPYYKSFELQNSFLNKSANFRLPWLEEMQLRYRDNEFQNSEQRYALRLKPGNPWEIGQNKKYFQGLNTLKLLEQKLVLKNILGERYANAVEYWMAAEMVSLLDQQKNKRIAIGNALAKKVASSDFDADQYLNSQIDIISKETDWHEAILERDVAQSKILSGSGKSDFEFSITDLITIDGINQLVQSEINSSSRAELDLFKQKIALSDQKIKLEKSGVDLGFLQAMYTNRDNKGRSPLGLAFGVNIPLFNNNRDNIAKEKIDILERQGEMEQFATEESRRLYSTVINLNLHFTHYQKLDSLIQQFKNRGLNSGVGLANNYDPIIELKYQEKLIQFDLLKVRIKKEILSSYLNWLMYTDKIQGRPLVNYLTKNLSPLEE